MIAAGSLVPLPESGGTATIPVTAVGHLVGYGALAYCITRVSTATGVGAVTAVILATAVGAGIELLQVYVPTRSFAWTDIALNAGGATAGAGAGVVRNRTDAHEDDLGERDIPDGYE